MNNYKDSIVCNYTTTEKYQADLMCVFGLSLSDIDNLSYKIDGIYKEIENEKFKAVYDIIRNKVIFLHDCQDDMCFAFLFGYDTFNIMHKLLCFYKKTNKLSNDIIKELLDKVSEI
jgi:hypothetical protein